MLGSEKTTPRNSSEKNALQNRWIKKPVWQHHVRERSEKRKWALA